MGTRPALVIMGVCMAALSGQAQFKASINDGPLLAFWQQNNMSPVPSAYQNQVVPGAIIRRVGINTDVLGLPGTAKSLDIVTDQRYQPAVTIDTARNGSLIATILGYDAQLKLGTTRNVEIGQANISCKSIPYLDVQKLIYADPEVKTSFQNNGGKNSFVYVVQQVCYTTSLTLTDKSSHEILAGVNASPKDCSSGASNSGMTAKVSDLQSDASKKATSTYGAAASWCTDSDKKIVINTQEPYAVSAKVIWVTTPTKKYPVPDAATDPNQLRAVSWVDLRIR